MYIRQDRLQHIHTNKKYCVKKIMFFLPRKANFCEGIGFGNFIWTIYKARKFDLLRNAIWVCLCVPDALLHDLYLG